MSPSNGETNVHAAPLASSAPARADPPFLARDALERRLDELLCTAFAPSAAIAYDRARGEWTTFARAYGLSEFPTADTLSLYVPYRLREVTPASIQRELSGMGYYFEAVDAKRWARARNSAMVNRALAGAANSNPDANTEVWPLPVEHLVKGVETALSHSTYDDLAWAAMLIVCFLTCTRSQEITNSDRSEPRKPRNHTLRNSVTITDYGFSATHSYPKADALSTTSELWFRASDAGALLNVVRLYLRARDANHGADGALWLDYAGTVPTPRFFEERLEAYCGEPYTGYSIQAGGASYYMRRGASDATIRHLGRWSSAAWDDYLDYNVEICIAQRNRDCGATHVSAPGISAKLAARLTELLR